MALKKYNPEHTCPKCHSGTITTRFCPGDDSVKQQVHGTVVIPPPPTGGPTYPLCRFPELNTEHMHRTCGVCQFEWAEAPLDG